MKQFLNNKVGDTFTTDLNRYKHPDEPQIFEDQTYKYIGELESETSTGIEITYGLWQNIKNPADQLLEDEDGEFLPYKEDQDFDEDQ